jgi:hypothetical protein
VTDRNARVSQAPMADSPADKSVAVTGTSQHRKPPALEWSSLRPRGRAVAVTG